MTCPTPAALSRALSEGADGALLGHLSSCPSCAREWEALTSLKALSRQIPWTPPADQQREDVRTSLLAAARLLSRGWRGPSRRRWPLPAAAVAAALMGLGFGLGAWTVPGQVARVPMAQAQGERRGTIHARGDARFAHLGPPRDEVVRLLDGTVLVEVDPLLPGERFRVMAGDGEVEVRGTAFEVIARQDHLERVHVLHGRVEVRPSRGAAVVLGAGGSWQPRPAR